MTYDGVGFVRWLRDEGADLRHGYWLTDHNMRVVRACEAGNPIDEEQADLICTRLDLHLHLIPANLRLSEPMRVAA
jgi:hypothetical protein